MKSDHKKLDFLVIDIDDTFIYHRTVAIANKLFLEEISGRKINKVYTTKEALFLTPFLLRRINKKVFLLMKTGIKLYLLNLIRVIKNKLFSRMSSEKMIKTWADAIIKLKVDRYNLSKEVIEKNLNKKVLEVYNSLKEKNPKMKVVAISEHFNIGKDVIKDILGIDLVKSNEFIFKNEVISGFKLNVKDGKDKFSIASKFQAKNIGLIIEDYDDLDLLRLKNIKFVFYKKKLERFIKNKDISLLSFR